MNTVQIFIRKRCALSYVFSGLILSLYDNKVSPIRCLILNLSICFRNLDHRKSLRLIFFFFTFFNLNFVKKIIRSVTYYNLGISTIKFFISLYMVIRHSLGNVPVCTAISVPLLISYCMQIFECVLRPGVSYMGCPPLTNRVTTLREHGGALV